MGQKHREIPKYQDIAAFLSPFAQAFALERARWPLWLPVAMAVGIGLYFAMRHEPPLLISWAAVLALFAIAWGFRTIGAVVWTFCALVLAFVALGFGLAGLSTWRAAEPTLVRETGPVRVTGQVMVLEQRPRGVRVTLQNLTISRLSPDQVPKAVRVTLAGSQPDFKTGDWLLMRASLSPPSPPAAPGAFDFQRQSYFQSLGGVGFSFGRAEVIGHGPVRGFESLQFRLDQLRHAIAGRVFSRLGGDEGAVAAALMTGQRGLVSTDAMDNFRASGLAHLLAISGLHVGLVAGIVFFAVRAILALVAPLALRYPVKKWAAGCALLGALLYALLAGWTVPTQRAFLMTGVMLAAVMLDRRALTMRTVAWAAMLILAFAPEALVGASFQLSFAAVTALVAVYEVLRDKGWFVARRTGVLAAVWRYGLGVALSSLVAGAATAAFAAFHFNRVADYGLAANIVAVPLTALWIMPWAVTAFALMPFGVEGLALDAMGVGVGGVLSVADGVASWPGAQSLVPAFPVWGLVLITLGGVWAAIWRKPWRFWGVGPMVAGVLTLGLTPTPDVLIDASATLAAVKTTDGGYSVSTLTSKRFARNVWLRRAGLDQAQSRWADWAASLNGVQPMRCDALGCLYEPQPGYIKVAFVRTPEALIEDCRLAHVVVDMRAVGEGVEGTPCPAPLRIDLADLARDGAHALYFERGGQIRVDTVGGRRGNRPWTSHVQP